MCENSTSHTIYAELQAWEPVLRYPLSWDISECRRNELVALDLFLTAVATAFAFVSMVGEGPDPPDGPGLRAACHKHPNSA